MLALKKTFSRNGKLLVARLLLAAAFVLAVYLASISLSGGSVAGCGPDSNCHQVLTSRWSSWLGLPVSLLAATAYLALFVASFRVAAAVERGRAGRAGELIAVLAIVVIGAAFWFVALQLFVIQSVCPFCMTAHVCGVAAVAFLLQANRNPVTQRRDESGQSVPGKGWAFQTKSLLAGVAALAALIGGQVLHRPAAFVVHASTTTNQLFAPTPVERTLAIHEGRFLLNLRELPVMGSPEASRVIVSLFDYTCHHCRYMHGQLKTVQHTFSNELAIVSLPLPLDEHCNRFVRQTPSAHVGACEYARLGLAVWRAKPAVFSEFDDWVFAPHLPAALNEVRRRAEELAGRDALERALADGWGDRRILEDVAIYEANYRQSRRGEMPQLIIGSGIVAGVIDSTEELYRIIEERLGLVRAR